MDKSSTDPTISIWITSTGRETLFPCIEKFLELNTYPNYELLIYESNPDNDNNTMKYLEKLTCPHKLWHSEWPKLGWVYNHFLQHTGEYFIRVDDDCWPVEDPAAMFRDAIHLLKMQGFPSRISHVALDMNPRIAWNPDTGKLCPAVETDTLNYRGVHESSRGPTMLFRNPPGVGIVKRSYLGASFTSPDAPWDGAEARHIGYLFGQKLWTAYMLKWWGVYGHYGRMSSDGHNRDWSVDAYEFYENNGYHGRRSREQMSSYVVRGENILKHV
jgi:hypothetical protein